MYELPEKQIQNRVQIRQIDGWNRIWSSEAEHGLEVDLAIGSPGGTGAERASCQSIGLTEKRRGKIAHQRRDVDVVGDVAANGGQRKGVAARGATVQRQG